MTAKSLKILFVGLRYHRYTDEIIDELRLAGHEVEYHDIQPRDLWMRTLRVVAPAAYRRGLDRAHARILERAREQRFDLVLFVQAHQMRVQTLEALRRSQPQAEFVLYNWDAITNHDYRPQLHCFDRVYTFDPDDAQALGVGYLPLFCIRQFQDLPRREQHRHAVYFVGNIVSVQRYEALQAFKRYCRREGIEFQSFLACSTVVLGWLLRAGHRPWDVRLRSIGTRRFLDMVETSVAVFDFANHRQSGYTMRTMENLCAGKKIITANAGIRREAWCTPDRVHVFQGNDFTGIAEFLRQPLADPQARFEQYHLARFVRVLTGEAAPPETGR
jgi:hypothetical protein